jgi:hypothetical protein
MAINRVVTARKDANAVDAFIGRAPDCARKSVIRGRNVQITLTTAPDLLTRTDNIASRMGQTRAALINRAIYDRAIYELPERVAS